MDFQSTASQSIHNDNHPEDLSLTSYLINTSKAVKGHKLKTRDFIKLQLMKFRRCSPVKYQDLLRPDLSNPTTDFIKFKAFEGQREGDIQRIVTNQRQKMSRETKGRIKLFNNTKINSMFDDVAPTTYNLEDNFKQKPATSHSKVANRNYSNFKTIGNDMAFSTGVRQKTNKSLMFRSDNLDKKMNHYLNQYLADQREESQNNGTFPKRISFNVVDDRKSQTIDVIKKKPNIAYIRRMKKHHRNRGDQAKAQLIGHFQSEQLVKPHTANPIRRRQLVLLTQGKPN